MAKRLGTVVDGHGIAASEVRMAPANIRDVAARAGVAVSTVSVVLNAVDGARVSDATRKRVRQAAQDLGYTPNANARNLRGAKAEMIALVADRIATSAYGVGIVEGAQHEAWRRGVDLIVLGSDGDATREREALARAQGMRCDGVILASAQYEVRTPPEMAGLVMANCRPLGEPDDQTPPHAVPDEYGCGLDSAMELVRCGHRRITAIVSDSYGGHERAEGIRAGLAQAGLELAGIVHSSPLEATAAGGLRDAEHLLTEHPDCTAILCFNDRIAMGAYHWAARSGRRIPDDLSVVGSDDIEPIAESLDPGLTTWAAPDVEIGEWAVRVCLDRDDPAWKRPRRNAFARTLTRRGSATMASAPTSQPGGAMAG